MFEIEDIVGNCPVQAHGRFDGFPFYYRSRHGRWRVEVGKTKDAEPPAFNGTTQIVLEGDDENGGYMAGQGELDIQRIWLAYRKFQEMQKGEVGQALIDERNILAEGER
jgi:hypothetical protein